MALWNLCTFPPACLPGCPGQPVLLLVLLTSLGSIQERKSVLPLCSDSTHLSQVSVTLLTPVPSSGNPDREPHSSSGVHSVCSRPAYTYLEHFSLLEYGSFTHSACLLPVFSPWTCTFSFPEGPTILKFKIQDNIISSLAWYIKNPIPKPNLGWQKRLANIWKLISHHITQGLRQLKGRKWLTELGQSAQTSQWRPSQS